MLTCIFVPVVQSAATADPLSADSPAVAKAPAIAKGVDRSATNSQTSATSRSNTPVTFSFDKRWHVRDLLFRLAKASLRQSGPVVTVEIASTVAATLVPPQASATRTVADWLCVYKTYVPSLTWSFSDGVIHVILPGRKPYDPFSATIGTSLVATKTVREWVEWIIPQFPVERLEINDIGYGDEPAMDEGTDLPKQVVLLDVKKGMTVREFLTALAAGYGGTWVTDIQDPSLHPKVVISPYYGTLAIRNYTYLFRAIDPYLYSENQ